VSVAEKPDGFAPISAIARRNDMSHRRAKRMLKKHDARLRELMPDGPFLLHPDGPGGANVVDLSVLRQHLPGLIVGEPSDRISELADLVDEALSLLRDVRGDTVVIRRAMGR